MSEIGEERAELMSDAAARVLDLEHLALEILGTFSSAKGDGYRARVGQVQMSRWFDRLSTQASESLPG